MAISDDFPNAEMDFYRPALHYYAAGRFSALCAHLPVCGNILHHAIEMFLKGALTRKCTLEELKKLGHNLPKIWSEFKTLLPRGSLADFDGLVDMLHEFEGLRYPDYVLGGDGAHITLTFGPAAAVNAHSPYPPSPSYLLSIYDIVRFMNELFRICGIDPEVYLMKSAQAKYVIAANPESFLKVLTTEQGTPKS